MAEKFIVMHSCTWNIQCDVIKNIKKWKKTHFEVQYSTRTIKSICDKMST